MDDPQVTFGTCDSYPFHANVQFRFPLKVTYSGVVKTEHWHEMISVSQPPGSFPFNPLNASVALI